MASFCIRRIGGHVDAKHDKKFVIMQEVRNDLLCSALHNHEKLYPSAY